MILQALMALSEGHDVTIVARDMQESVRIARLVVSGAKAYKIPCINVAGCSDPDAPRVKVRPFGVPPPLPTPPGRVFIDHSAAFERPSTRPPRERTVITARTR